MFVNALFGRNTFPLSSVVHGLRDEKTKEVTVTLSDGTERIVAGDAFADALASTVQAMVPAQPGTMLLSEVLNGDDGHKEVDEAPIIAWALAYDGVLYPVTTEGPCNDANTYILHPNGRVEQPACGSWDTFEQFLESVGWTRPVKATA